jgi:hypothetical protein
MQRVGLDSLGEVSCCSSLFQRIPLVPTCLLRPYILKSTLEHGCPAFESADVSSLFRANTLDEVQDVPVKCFLLQEA